MLKRLIDLSVSGIGLAACGPLMGALGLAIAVDMGRPVLFRQRRPGRDGRVFRVAKFRTMNEARDAQGQLLPDAERLTRLGAFLRRTSLDELPQLLNVFAGEMSLVGPRPLLESYLELYSARQARRHEVRPGITGWAQVNGRNALDWAKRLELDVYYVEHQSLLFDLEILLRTALSVLRQEGIAADGEATMPHFRGERL